jgi:hypothetical protein
MAKYTVTLCFVLMSGRLFAGDYSLEQSLTGHHSQVSESDTYKIVTGWGNPPAEVPQGQPVLQSETYAYLVLIKNMKNLTPGQKERSMGELLIRGKSETSGISILPEGQ